MIVHSGLSSPANMERAVNVALAPLHDLAQFRPIVHVLEGQVLDRSASDDHSVEELVSDRVEGLVEREHMFCRSILVGPAACRDELNLDLKRSVAQKPCQLRLRSDLRGHEVKDQNAQRPDILTRGSSSGHDEDIFALKDAGGRKVSGNVDWHLLLVSFLRKSLHENFVCFAGKDSVAPLLLSEP